MRVMNVMPTKRRNGWRRASSEFLLYEAVARRLEKHFARHSGHSLLQLSVGEAGSKAWRQPPIDCSNCAHIAVRHSYLVGSWRLDATRLRCRSLKVGDLPAAMFDHKI